MDKPFLAGAISELKTILYRVIIVYWLLPITFYFVRKGGFHDQYLAHYGLVEVVGVSWPTYSLSSRFVPFFFISFFFFFFSLWLHLVRVWWGLSGLIGGSTHGCRGALSFATST